MDAARAAAARLERGLGDRRAQDAALAGAIAALTLFGTFMAARNQPDREPLDALAVLLLVAAPLALAFRRRRPVATLGGVLAATFAYELLGYPEGPIWAAPIVALLSAHAGGHRAVSAAAVAAGWTSMWWLPALLDRDMPAAGEVVAFSAWMLLLLTGGEVLRVRRAYAEQGRERTRAAEHARAEEARRRRSEERLRIARELHDVLAHNISLINVQASTALHLLGDRPAQARPALAAIKGASGEALAELRSVLDALRASDGPPTRTPAPTLARLDELLDQARAAGLGVRLETAGTPRPLPAGVELAAYRICQEAVTNVLRHAGPAEARVRLEFSADAMTVDVRDDGRGTGAPGIPGRGLTGMRERAGALGGTLEAGPAPGGGFRVRAVLPLGHDGAAA